MVRTARVRIRRTAAVVRGAGAGAGRPRRVARPAPGPTGLTCATRVSDRAAGRLAGGQRQANRPDVFRSDGRLGRPPRMLEDRRGRRTHPRRRLAATPGRSVVVVVGSTTRSRAGRGGRGCRRPTPRRLAGPDPDRPPRHLLGATSRGWSGWSPRVHPPDAAGAYGGGPAHPGVGGRDPRLVVVAPMVARPGRRCSYEHWLGTGSRISCGGRSRTGDRGTAGADRPAAGDRTT